MMRKTTFFLVALCLSCSDPPAPAPVPVPVPVPVPDSVAPEAEPEVPGDPYGPMPAEGETDLVLCSLSVVLEDDVVLAMGDVILADEGSLIIACDGGLLAMTPLPARECRLVSNDHYGIEGWIAMPELRAATDRLQLDDHGVVHVVGRARAIDPHGQLVEALEPAPPSLPVTLTGIVRAASAGFVVLDPAAPTELSLLDGAGALRRVIHAGGTIDFGLEMVDPGATHALLRGVSNTRERLTYATYEVSRGEAQEPGVVRIAGL